MNVNNCGNLSIMGNIPKMMGIGIDRDIEDSQTATFGRRHHSGINPRIAGSIICHRMKGIAVRKNQDQEISDHRVVLNRYIKCHDLQNDDLSQDISQANYLVGKSLNLPLKKSRKSSTDQVNNGKSLNLQNKCKVGKKSKRDNHEFVRKKGYPNTDNGGIQIAIRKKNHNLPPNAKAKRKSQSIPMKQKSATLGMRTKNHNRRFSELPKELTNSLFSKTTSLKSLDYNKYSAAEEKVYIDQYFTTAHDINSNQILTEEDQEWQKISQQISRYSQRSPIETHQQQKAIKTEYCTQTYKIVEEYVNKNSQANAVLAQERFGLKAEAMQLPDSFVDHLGNTVPSEQRDRKSDNHGQGTQMESGVSLEYHRIVQSRPETENNDGQQPSTVPSANKRASKSILQAQVSRMLSQIQSLKQQMITGGNQASLGEQSASEQAVSSLKELAEVDRSNSVRKKTYSELDYLLMQRIANLAADEKQEVGKLEKMFNDGKLDESALIAEKKTVARWINYQLENVEKVKESLRCSMVSALQIIGRETDHMNENRHRSNKTELDSLRDWTGQRITTGKAKSMAYLKIGEGSKYRNAIQQAPKNKASRKKVEMDQSADFEDSPTSDPHLPSPMHCEDSDLESSLEKSKDLDFQQSSNNRWSKNEKAFFNMKETLVSKSPYSEMDYLADESQSNVSCKPGLSAIRTRFPGLDSSKIQEIFEFTFIDLCLQIMEIMPAARKVTDQLKICVNRKKKGFNTGRKQLEKLVNQFIKHINDSSQNSQQVFRNINIAIGPNPLQLLKFMRNYEGEPQQSPDCQIPHLFRARKEGDSSNESLDPADQELNFIFNHHLFAEFSKNYVNAYKFQTYYTDPDKEERRIVFLKNALHIYNKAIFDSLNENADKYRVYGLYGQPLPWKKQSRLVPMIRKHTSPTNQLSSQVISRIVEDVRECSFYLCGIMADREFGYGITEYEAVDLRQDRLSKMLAKDIIDNEQRWVFFDDEQTELLVQTSNWVFITMIKQVCSEIPCRKQ